MKINYCHCGNEAMIIPRAPGATVSCTNHECGNKTLLCSDPEHAIRTWNESGYLGPLRKHNKYQREIKPGTWVDVYDVLRAFDVTCPAMAHAVKKCLAPGQRGVKDSVQDKNEAIASIKRSIEMEKYGND